MDFDSMPPGDRSASFSSVFSGMYSSRDHSYIWAHVLVADSIEWFKAPGDLPRANGERFRPAVLSQGGSAEAMARFPEFTAGDPAVAPLLRRRGRDEPGN